MAFWKLISGTDMEITAEQEQQRLIEHTGELMALKAVVAAILNADSNLRLDQRFVNQTINHIPIHTGSVAAQEKIRERARMIAREILAHKAPEQPAISQTG